MKKYIITTQGINNDYSAAKLWYSDEIIIFDNEEQIEEYVKEMDKFFTGIKYSIEDIKYDKFELPHVLYSDLIVDAEYIMMKKHIERKYCLIDIEYNELIRNNQHVIIFDNEEQIEEFIKTFPNLCKYEPEMCEIYYELGWYLFIRYEDFKKTDSYEEALGIFG